MSPIKVLDILEDIEIVLLMTYNEQPQPEDEAEKQRLNEKLQEKLDAINYVKWLVRAIALQGK